MSAENAEKSSAVEASQDKPVMKTMANCNPVDFLRQSNKIKHAVEDLFGSKEIVEIRKRIPALTGEETKEEKKKLLKKQGRKNFSDILDVLLDTSAEDTAALLAMMCFREPKDMEHDTMMMYWDAIGELLSCKAVTDFLSPLFLSALKNTDG